MYSTVCAKKMFRLIKFSVLSAAVLACCSSFAAGEEPADERLFDVPAVAPDAPVNFPTGLFAVEERGRFYNHNTFYCRGSYGNFCIPIEKKKLTEEEKGYFYARPVHADVLVEFDSSTGTFSLSGHMLLNENYRLTTAQSNETYGSYSPRPCERDAQQNTIKCTMSNPDEFKEHGSAANVAVTFGVLGDQEIFLKDFEVPEYLRTDEYRDYVNIMKGVILGAESEQELIHNTFISEKLDFTLSDALLNIYWKGLPAKVRTDIKSEQIKWIKDKESSCGKINPKSSEKEQAQVYKCQRLTTEKRVRYLSDLQ